MPPIEEWAQEQVCRSMSDAEPTGLAKERQEESAGDDCEGLGLHREQSFAVAPGQGRTGGRGPAGFWKGAGQACACAASPLTRCPENPQTDLTEPGVGFIKTSSAWYSG